MDAIKMKEILKTEYKIYNEKEFNAAVSKSAGIDLGIFTMPLIKRSVRCEQSKKGFTQKELANTTNISLMT